MFSIELMGGLGNQLFQIFMLLAYSKREKENFLIEKKEKLPGQYVTRNVYWNTLFDKLFNRLINGVLNYHIIRENFFHYEDVNLIKNKVNELKKNNITKFKFYGYYQSYKYFEGEFKEIINDLDFKTKRENVLKKWNSLNENISLDNLISLHFRIGDYKKLQDYHPLITLSYYKQAIQTITKRENMDKYNILFFCEENDIDYVEEKYINELKKVFNMITFTKVNNSFNDWEQMLLMSLCKHNIIANSSFSWWGAYLSYGFLNDEQIKNKIVCYPDKWFGKKLQDKITSDLFPENWIKCNTDIISKYELENVFYINLNERKDRKELVERELNKMNWKYERFDAKRLKDGRAGCSLSHINLIENAKNKKLEYIVIVEDDIQFTNPKFLNEKIKEFINMNMEYDVLLLAGNLRQPLIKEKNNIFRIYNSWTTTGYMVKKAYYDTLLKNYKEGFKKLLQFPQTKGIYEIDSYWKSLQMKDKWYMICPRTVTQRPDFSNIENRFTDYNHLMLDLEKDNNNTSANSNIKKVSMFF